MVLTLTPLISLNIQLDALAEHIMASFLPSPETRTTIAVGFSDAYGLPSVSILRVPVPSNLSQSIVYEISKPWLFQYWVDWNLTHMSEW